MRLGLLRRKGGGTLSLSSLYDEARLVPHVRKGLNMMMSANVFGTLYGSICGGGTAAMIGLAGMMGAGDLEFGLLAAIPQVANCLQLPFSQLVNRTHKRKIYMLTIGLLSRMLWLVFGFVPMMMRAPDDKMPLYLTLALVCLSSATGSVINVCWFPWFSDLAPLRIRGRWLSIRDVFVSSASFLFGLLVAYMLDVLPANSKYLIVFMVGGILGSADMICFGFVKEEWKTAPQNVRLSSILRDMLHNKPFLKVVLLWTVWCFTACMSGSYLTPYAMNSMHLSFMQIMVFGTMTASLFTIVAVPRWGRALDQCGVRNVMRISCMGASLTPLFYLLSTPGSIWPTFLHNAVGALFWSGCNLAANGMQLTTSPDESRPTYIAVFSIITGLGNALGTMTGATILEGLHVSGLFLGFFDRYKALAVISVVLRFSLSMLIIGTMTNDSEASLRDILPILLPFAKRKRRK